MVDVRFDYRTDCPSGKDPDKYSKKLKDDHCSLWSRIAPNNSHLHFYVEKNIICCEIDGIVRTFSPDSITNCFTYWDKTKELREREDIKSLISDYKAIDYTIGSSLIFPIKNDDNSSKWTINKARGCSRKICDRIDLTLECIRLYYLDKETNTPLKSCLVKHSFFFNLFGSFKNYVKFFFLDDLVSSDYSQVLSLTETLDFDNPLPTEANYADYIKKTIDFINNRNERIKRYVEEGE